MSANNVQPGSTLHETIASLRSSAEEKRVKAEAIEATEPLNAAALRASARRLDRAAENLLFSHRYGF